MAVLDEERFQREIVSALVGNGYEEGQDSEVDRENGLYLPALIRFVQQTQPKAWAYFATFSDPAAELITAVRERRAKVGTLGLLKFGLPASGGRPAVHLAFPRPASRKNEDAWRLYRQNIFTVVRECHFENRKKPSLRIDLALFVNGIPYAAAELKNETTGSSFEDAELQWQISRSPIHPLLAPNLGFMNFWAISSAAASFTSRLAEASTRFLPYNKGYQFGAGNDPADHDVHGHRTYYIWETVWAPDNVLTQIFGLLHYAPAVEGTPPESLELRSPRYHQLDALQKTRDALIAGTGAHKKGGTFLFQHSAGSGKTLLIAWLAHMLNALHDAADKPMFDAVIILTDRTVVDRQLQAQIDAIAPHRTLVGVVDGNSKQLAGYLNSGKRVIVCTIQKFSYIKDLLRQVSQDRTRSYAIIVDEAHSGQTGKNAAAVRDTLTNRDLLADEDTLLDALTGDEKAMRSPNMTFFAFTATPREDTLARFTPDGKPFHTYSMRQAIEEQFILNPLENYTTHEIVVALSALGGAEQESAGRRSDAHRALGSKVRASEETLEHKVRTVLDHMVDNTIPKLDGQGKGMVVADSRWGAYQWLKMAQRLIAEEPRYAAVKPLIAYTGSLDIPELDEKVTEATLNGFPESQTTGEFDRSYNLLIVASKYQVGFDQRKLCSMFLDRKLSGVTAVQTVSRINRIVPGMNKSTSVIDFADNADEFRKAFSDYHLESSIAERRVVTEADLLVTARRVVSSGFRSGAEMVQIVTSQDAKAFREAEAALARDPLDEAAAATARALVLTVRDKITLARRLKHDAALDAFRSLARQYLDDYLFLSQFATIQDPRLKDLRNYLEIALKQFARHSSVTSEWLDHIVIQMTAAHERTEDFSEFAAVKNKTEQTDAERSTTATGSLDEPITVQELVEEWNAKLTRLVGPLPRSPQEERNSAESAHNAKEAGEDADAGEPLRALFAALGEQAAVDPSLREYAAGRSFERFRDAEGQTRAHRLIALFLAHRLDDEEMFGHVLEQFSSGNPEFQQALTDFVLATAYLAPTQ